MFLAATALGLFEFQVSLRTEIHLCSVPLNEWTHPKDAMQMIKHLNLFKTHKLFAKIDSAYKNLITTPV